MSSSFQAGELERRYAFLDRCPERLVPAVVTGLGGSLEERVEGLLTWREALLRGELPVGERWPAPSVSQPARRALEDMGLVRFCRGQPELVDELLEDLLRSFSERGRELQRAVATRLRELEALERKRLDERRARRRRTRQARLSDQQLEELQRRARIEVEGRAKPDARLLEAWAERARAWAAVAEVFGDLGQMLGRGWDLSQGVLRHTGWTDLLRLRALVERLPQLKEIVRSLGRLRVSDSDEEPVSERVLVPVRRLEEERREVTTPLVPAETRGVQRSGDVARMLPVEAALLGHPRLRLLWHARRAEGALLTYRVEGVEVEITQVEREHLEEVEKRTPRPERGPILAVLDTSGSMHGTPELVAKALVLEALRTAHAEKRRCLLFSYSGPGQVLEQELSLSPEGLGQLLSFLGMSFGGGNDETGVMTQVLERIRQEAWKKADVVFVSDGEWPAPRSLVELVAAVREEGTRLHGVQLGNRGTTGLHAVCEPVHVFQDWAALGGW